MAAEQQELAILVRAKDLASRTIGKVNKSLDGLGKHAQRGVSNALVNLKRLGMIGAGVAAGLGIAAIKFASDWETAATSVRKTVDGNVEGILVGIQDMSRRIPLAAEALAGIAAQGGALGIANKDILEFTESVALLSETADDVSFEQGADSLGHLKTTMGLAGKDFSRTAAAITELGNNGATTEGQILGMAERVAGAARLVRLGKAETIGWAAALANTGMEIEASGSALQKFFLQSFKAVGKGGKALQIYAKVAGTTGRQFQQHMDKDFSGAMERFIVGLGKLDEQTQLATLEDLGFTDIRITRALLSLTGNTDNLTDSLRMGKRAWKENRATADEAEKKFATFSAGLTILRNNLRLIGTTLGTAVLPHLNKVVRRFNDWLADPAQQQAVKDLADAAGVAFADLLADAEEFASTVDWDSVLTSARDALSVGQQALSAAFRMFNSAPDWLKTAIITGWGLNKLTGGAFGAIVGELGKGLVKGVLGITAGTVNVTGGVVRGGLGPAAAGGAARGSIVAGAASGILTVAIAAGSIYALAEAWKGVMEDVGFSQLEVNAQTTAFERRGKTPGASPLEGTLALQTLSREIRASLETGNVLLDVANKVALGVGANEQFQRAVLVAARQGLTNEDLTREQLEARLAEIHGIQQLELDQDVLTTETAQRIAVIERAVQARIERLDRTAQTGNRATERVESAVRAQDFRITIPVTITTSATLSGREVVNETTKQVIRSRGDLG